MASMQDFIDKLKDNLNELGKQELKEQTDALVKDGLDFVKEVDEDLKKWIQQLAVGEMSVAGFKMAVAGKAELAKMKAITQVGLTEIHVAKLKQQVIDTVIATATKTFLA
ncbi:MAG: hypothetical protein HOC71_03990 [Candidatus Latescibacteria bacterium]|jgi:hypothetical protein|nr:hypothetical protein [Candidatus Latescibacterota bacterium]